MQETWDVSLIPGLGRSPGGGHGNPLQYSYLGNPMDRGAWQATAHRVTKSQTWLKWQHASRHVVIRELWHPSGNGWCHIQAELGGHYSGIQGSFSRVGIQSNMVSFSPCHYLTLESCLFLSVFLWWVWSPSGSAPPFPAGHHSALSLVLSFCP